MHTFSIEESIKTGWNTIKNNWLFILEVEAMYIVFTFVFSSLENVFSPSNSSTSNPIIYFLLLLISFVIDYLFQVGFIRISLALIKNIKPQLNMIFQTESLTQFFLASLLVGFIVLLGLILLIIPGIYFAIRLVLTPYFVVDKGLNAIDAVKASWHATKGNMLKIIGFGLVSSLILFIGAILLGIGLVIAIPLVALATAAVYYQLSDQGSTPQMQTTQPATV